MEDKKIEIDYDRLNLVNKNDIVMEAKLNILSYFQMNAYNPDTYKLEENIKIKNEKDEDENKHIPVKNFIRWRNNNNKIESNAKLVEWSDGSYQLIIGDQHFELLLTKMDNVRLGIKGNDKMNIITKPFEKRILLTQSEDNIKDDITITKNKVGLMYSYYDKKRYRKEDFSSKYPRRRKDPSDAPKIGKKRKR